MASVNKKFAVEKGLEVGDQALVVDADNERTGIGKTNPEYGLDVELQHALTALLLPLR